MEHSPFSFFGNGIYNNTPSKSISVAEAYEILISETHKKLVARLRATHDKKEANKLKTQLDYVTFSGVFSVRNKEGLTFWNKYICFDFDALQNVDEARKKLYSDKYTLLGFLSPSGQGLKIVVRVDSDSFEESWKQLYNYFSNTYQLNADTSCKDISRACFLSYDPEAYLNLKSEDFPTTPKNKKSKPVTVSLNSELVRAKIVAERIFEARLDITEDYDTWLKIGFALASFGEDGRAIFHQISQFSDSYKATETDKKFDNLLQNSKFKDAGYFFKKAHEHGIKTTKSISVESHLEVEKTAEIHRNRFVIYNLQDFTIEIDNKKGKSNVAEGFLLYIDYQTFDENNQNTWILRLETPNDNTIYLEVSHDDFYEPKALEKILGTKRLSTNINYLQLQKLRGFLFGCTEIKTASKVLRYGLHPATELYFFSNCAIDKGGRVLYPDKLGIIQHDSYYLSIPQVNKWQKSPFEYVESKIDFNSWYKLFSTAQTEDITFLATSFLLFSIFRDIGIEVNGFSPMLYIYGIAGTAKSTLFVHLNYIFGTDGKGMGVNLKAKNTEPSFVAKMEQRYNGFVFGDEYKPNHQLTPQFQASYDNKAYSKMDMTSKSYLDTTDLVPKCTIGFASNFLPDLPQDEPFFSRLVMLVNNNRNRTTEQSDAYRELVKLQESGITTILREIWQNRDLVKREFSLVYQKLKAAMEHYYTKHKIGNPRYIYNLAQILTVPFILCRAGKIQMCEAVDEEDILHDFIRRSEKSILLSDRIVQDKSNLREFFESIQELSDRGHIRNKVHFRMEGADIVFNFQRLYKKYTIEFKRQNNYEISPPSMVVLQDELMDFCGLDPNSENAKKEFFRKLRFRNEIEHSKSDTLRNCFRLEYNKLQDSFGLDLNFSQE